MQRTLNRKVEIIVSLLQPRVVPKEAVAEEKEVDACLKNPQACQQLDQLETDMRLIEQAQDQQALPDDYGQQLWQQIADQLQPENNSLPKEPVNWLQRLKDTLLVPQFSIASLVLVTGLVMVAFFAGRHCQNSFKLFVAQSPDQRGLMACMGR